MAAGVKLLISTCWQLRQDGDEMKLTPDCELQASLEVPGGESGDVADVAAFVGLLRAGDEQSRVLRGVGALELDSAGVTPERWQKNKKTGSAEQLRALQRLKHRTK